MSATLKAKTKTKTGKNFFDRDVVMKAMSTAQYKVFKELGRRVRKTALASIPYKFEPSLPGNPPHAHHTGLKKKGHDRHGRARIRTVSLLKEFLFFSWDAVTKSVVIGPEKLHNTKWPESLHTLEYGGSATTSKREVNRFIDGKIVKVELGGTFQIAPRPFMGPAYAAEQPGLAALWRNALNK